MTTRIISSRAPWLAVVFSVLVAGLIAVPLSGAQEDGAYAEQPVDGGADVSVAVTTEDPGVEVEHLRLLLQPLTKGEMQVEAEAWRGLLKAKVTEISAREIAQKTGEEEANAPAELPELKTLREQKAALLARLQLVLDAYERKGGDAEELRKYAAAVAGVNVDVTDVSGTWTLVSDWVTSKDGGIRWGGGLLKFCVILLVFWILARAARRVVRRAISKNKRISHLLKQFINRLVARTVFCVGILVALSTIGFNVGALLALIGGGAFIIGFALQDSLSNFAAGVMLLIYRPFDVGDFVDVGGIAGKVDSVSLVSTTIRTVDNKVVLVPNKKVWGEVITNASASPERRVDLIFGIGYGDDLEKAQGVIERVVSENDLVLAEPEPVIRVHELADSSVNFVCRPWVKTADYWDVYWDLTRRVKEAFDREGISIPFPQRDVYVHQVSPPAEA